VLLYLTIEIENSGVEELKAADGQQLKNFSIQEKKQTL
jgi:hypothetical protein